MTRTASVRCLMPMAATLVLPASLLAQEAGRVVFEQVGYRLTALGAKTTVSARVLDARRRAVPNAPIAYRVSDPNIAVVSSQGVVQSKRVGRTMVWAVSGTDSASALIVVDQWASTFGFSPPAVTFDAIGAKTKLGVQLRDASGNAIPDLARTAQCRSRDEKIASFATNGQLTARGNGVVWIRCVDRGISDSVRVEVRQRPVRVAITDKLAHGNKNPQDTFRLRARAFDPMGDSIVGVRATWVSLASNIVSVDPVTGFARAIGGGMARIVTQIGDATDTVNVQVSGAAATVGDATAATDSAVGGALRQPTLEMEPVSPIVGEEARLSVTARDAAGTPIANPERFIAAKSTDETVVTTVSNPWRVVGKGPGSAWVVVRFSDAGTVITDSVLVTTRGRNANAGTQAAAAQKTIEFAPPVYDTAAANRRNRTQIDDMLRSIREQGIGRTTSGRTAGVDFTGALVNHSVHLTGVVTERRSGLLLGARGYATPFRWLHVMSTFRTGNLIPETGGGGTEDLKLTEVDSRMSLWITPQFGVGGGFVIRGEKQDVGGVKTLTAASVDAIARSSFVGGAVRTYTAVSLYPSSNFTGRTDKPETSSMSGEAGLEVKALKYLTASFTYYTERFTWAAVGTQPQRRDQLSMLRIRLGALWSAR